MWVNNARDIMMLHQQDLRECIYYEKYCGYYTSVSPPSRYSTTVTVSA